MTDSNLHTNAQWPVAHDVVGFNNSPGLYQTFGANGYNPPILISPTQEQISLAVANQARDLTEQYWRETVRELQRNQKYVATMAWTGWLLAAFLLVVLISCVEGPTIMQEWSRMRGA